MDIVPSAEFSRNIGHYQDRALIEPIIVTRNGRQRVVLLSADEFRRLKQLDREVLHVSALAPADLDAIASSEVPSEFAHLDSENAP